MRDPRPSVEPLNSARSELVSRGVGQSDEDIERIRKLIEIFPGWAAPRGLLVQALLARNEPDRALAQMRAGIAAGGARASNLVRLSHLERERGEDSWEASLELAEFLEPAHLSPRIARLKIAREVQGEAAELALLQEMVATRPHDVRLVSELAERHLQAERPEESLQAAAQIQRQAKHWARGFEIEGRVAEGQGRLEDALVLYDRADQESPAEGKFAVYAARIEWRLERREDAFARLSTAARRFPGNLPVRLEVAQQAMALGRGLEALEHYTVLSEADPTNPGHKVTLVRLQAAGGKDAACLATAEALLVLQPEEWTALVHGALALERLGRADEAGDWLARARKVDAEQTAALMANQESLRAVADRLDG